MLPGTRALRTFEAAARHLNFTRAADEVGLTPAAVSYQIKDIEDQLGVVLFTRTSRSIQLTPAGAVMFEATTDALDTLHRAAGRARKLTRNAAHLRVSLSARFATNWLLPRLPQFRAANPGLELSFDISDELRDFEADDIDVAIRVGPLENSDLVARHLADSWRVVCASPTCVTTHGMPKNPDDLIELPTLVLTTNAGPRNEWRLGEAVVRVRRYHECTDSEVIRNWAVLGRGFAYRQLWAVAADVREGRLMQINKPAWSAPTPIHAMYHPNVFQPPRVRRFVDFLHAELARRLPSNAEDAAAFLSVT